jgi:hypothetical protein
VIDSGLAGGATHNLIERLWNDFDYITTYGVFLDAVVHAVPRQKLSGRTRSSIFSTSTNLTTHISAVIRLTKTMLRLWQP